MGSGTISDCVSITEITIAAGWIAGLGLVALIATGWRKPARASADPARATRRDANGSADDPLRLTEIDTPLVRPVSARRRLQSAVAGVGLSIWVGAIAATFLGFGVSWLVITLTDMLKQ